MVCGRAGSECPTYTGARIAALLTDTGQVARTLGVYDALRLALDVRVADIVGDASAGGSVAVLRALGVDSARRRVAGFDNLGPAGCYTAPKQ